MKHNKKTMSDNIIKMLELLKELCHYGVSNNPNNKEIEEILQEMYLLKKRDENYVQNKNSLIELIINYNTDEFNVGGVSFYIPDDFIYLDDYICIASDGAGDHIAIDKKSGLIYNLLDDDSKIKIANSGENFIEKLVEVGKVNFSKKSKENNLLETLNKFSENLDAQKFYFSLMS